MAKIFKATIQFNIFIEAEGVEDVDEIIRENAEDELENTIDSAYFDPEIEEITGIEQVPQEWRGAIPYGSMDDETIDSKLNKKEKNG